MPAAAETVLINNGRVVTNGAGGIIENGDVLIVDGRISAVGANINAPRGARVIEANGNFVTPGAFAAMSVFAPMRAPTVRARAASPGEKGITTCPARISPM